MKLIEIKPSTRSGKKLMAVFEKDDGKTITTHFGSANMRDFTLINDKNSKFYIPNSGAREKVKQAYLRRHAKRENWAAYMTAGSLAKHILWEKRTLKSAIANYKRKFKL